MNVNEKEMLFIDKHFEELAGITGDRVIGFVYQTDDYDRLKFMPGNRVATDGRIKKIVDAYEEVGVRRVPGMCNDDMFVIDGEGRRSACRESGKPFSYVVDSTADSNVMAILNATSKNWETIDYIHNKSVEGNKDYQTLEYLISIFPNLSVLNTIVPACMGKSSGSVGRKTISEDRFKMEVEYGNVIDVLSFQEEIRQSARKLKGSTCIFLEAAAFAYRCEGVERETLVRKINAFCEDVHRTFCPIRLSQCIAKIDEVYNRNVKKKRVHIYRMYEDGLSDASKIRWGIDGGDR